MLKSIEICSGAGGLVLGEHLAGFKHELLIEKDKMCCNTLRENHPEWNVVCQDVNDFDIKKFKKDKHLKYNDIDLLSGGIPCQSFSIAGNRLGMEDARADVFSGFIEMIKVLQPKIVMMENVKGLLSINNGNILNDIIIHKIKECGYKVYYKVLNSHDFNVAQKRERLFIVGISNRLNRQDPFIFPKENPIKIYLKDILLDIPEDDMYHKEMYQYNDKMKEYLDKIPQGGCWTSLPVNDQIELLRGSYGKSGGMRGIARRLSMNEPSLTLTTSPMQKQTCRCHPLYTRPLSVREYARIQSFPDTWIFCGSKNNKYKQIGNAVPVNLAKAMALSIKDYLLK
jgi:DNA (cytosine-5)-methyltransferase 1